jgi:hypothetical protein
LNLATSDKPRSWLTNLTDKPRSWLTNLAAG